ncbi:ent-kaurene oxidase [Fusarium austroafricanum]|uniref:Ent-kaurene oxidase n=1 Tax=Fusarium austroafricanum TaxID=2364996 RepID=A0A8H4KUX7_9HYPO|nr:ent-kaurene oxidase [Fusarium austroafricanum]
METGAWSSARPEPSANIGAPGNFLSSLDLYQAIGIFFCVVAALAYLFSTPASGSNKFPTINPATGFEIVGKARRQDFMRNARSYFNKGLDMFPGKPFNILADHGEVTVLPASWAHDIRNEKNLNFMKSVHEDFHADFSPFKPFSAGTSDDALLQSVARKQLTKYLNQVTKPLSSETKFALDLTYGAPSEWKEFPLKPTLLNIVARISSCVFLGDKVCRNEAWLDITTSYTVLAFQAAGELRTYPKWIRGIVQLYLPSCRNLLGLIDRGRSIVEAIVQERRLLASQGKYKPTHMDAIDWFEEEAAGRPYDPTLCQLILSTAAIHTTSDLANQTLINLAQNPDIVKEVRKEVIEVLKTDGWKKTSLFNMKLLDSILKESQRLSRPPATMMRKALGDVTLPDGSILRKGERTMVSTSGMGDPQTYDDPTKFDPYRFVRLRDQEGMQNHIHLVSTGPSHLGFGHGKHACPGRFFASNELKILLCHIIIKYDFKLPEGYTPKSLDVGPQNNSDPASRMLFVAREPEIDIDVLEG